MFNKLISSLPFNPSLINQVSFYAQRLKKEASIRRLGFVLVLLTMVLQLFAVLSPAQPSLARAGNDLIPGGFTSKNQLVLYCYNNSFGIATILAHFKVSCGAITNDSTVVSLRATDYNNELYSMGRQPVGAVNAATGKVTNEVAVPIDGTTYYMRLLSSWDGNWVSTYQAVMVKGTDGGIYFVLFSCGNVVQITKPSTPPPPPPPVTPKPKPTPTPIPPTISKKARNITEGISDANGTTAKAGDIIQYTLLVKNTGKVTDKNFIVQDNVADILEYADLTSLNGAAKDSSGNLTWPAQNIAAGQTIEKQFQVKVKDPIPQTPSPCPPTSIANPCPRSGSFDLTMTNVYGNTINIKLPPTVIKTTEVVTTTALPNTGPGTSLIIGFSGAVVVGYFFARSRLLAKEVELIKKDYSISGGM